MKKLITLLFCAAALAWGGCSDSDEEGVTPELIVGKWLLVSEYDEWVDNGSVVGEEDPYLFEESLYIEFRADGTGTIYWDTNDASDCSSFGYRIDDGQIIWTSGTGFSGQPPYLEKLTSSALVMVWYYEEYGYKLCEKSIFKRVG